MHGFRGSQSEGMAVKKISANQVIYKLDFTEIVRLNIRLLQIFGNIAPEFQSNTWASIYFIYSTSIIGFLFIAMLISELVNMVMVMTDLEELSNASFLGLTHLVEAFKYYYIFKHRTKLSYSLNLINRSEFQPKNISQYNTLKVYIKNSKIITKMFLLFGFLACLLWGAYPFIDNGHFSLPLAGWYPFDTNNSPVFELIFVYQVTGTTLNGMANISIDSFMSGLVMVICAQLHILNDSLKHIRKNAEMEVNSKAVRVGEDISTELQEKMNEKLLDCIIHHKCIIEFADVVTFLFTNIIFGQFILSVVIICINFFEIRLLPLMSIKFLSIVFYQICILMEVFLVCYYGNEVIRESKELTKFAYCSDWIGCSEEYKRNLIFFMTRSQRELRLNAGGFVTLSLETFVKILKSSYSYFAVLNTMLDDGA